MATLVFNRLLGKGLFVCLFLVLGFLRQSWGQALPIQLFKESQRLLMGEIPVNLSPRREYIMKSGASGELKLKHGLRKVSYRAGEQLGGIDLEAFALQKELLAIEEALIMDRKLPQARMQKDTELAQYKKNLLRLDAEMKLTGRFLDDPEFYQQVYPTEESEAPRIEDLNETLRELKASKGRIARMMTYLESGRFEELEIAEIEKQMKAKRIQFEKRELEVLLTVPFDGEVQILFPYIEGESNFVPAGLEIAKLRDFNQIFADAPILNSKLRLIPKSSLELEVLGANGPLIGRYKESLQMTGSGAPKLIYRFVFPTDRIVELRPLLDGTVEGKLFLKLSAPYIQVPKFLLVATNPEVFRARGWPGIVESALPGYRLESVGLNEVAVTQSKKK